MLPESSLRGRQQSTISVDAKLINVLATVRDRRGKIISDLGKDDFTLDEDGRPQTIGYFSRETDLPLSLGLLVDTSGSTRPVLGEERSASHSFLDDMLRAGKDRAFIMHFDYEVELLQDLTFSRDSLERALDRLGESQFDPLGGYPRRTTRVGGSRGGSRPGFGGGGTLLYDAIFLASDEVMGKQLGRKALIVLTDGEDNGSRVRLENTIMTAQRADTVVYSILFTDKPQPQGLFGFAGQGRGGGISPPQQQTSGRKILEQISRETGGRMFEVTKKQSIGEIYKIIAEELRNQYSIGYSPTPTDAGPGYRKIHLVAKNKNYSIQTRDGYFADR